MGVIHKLTEDVINYILEKKKEDPKIGCRSLSEIVSERFSRKVSKSSINSVLKEHGLSGTIGRPAATGSQKKAPFSIPREKKKQLFGIDHVENPHDSVTAHAEVQFNSKVDKGEDRPQLRVDPIQSAVAETSSSEKPPRKKRQTTESRSVDSFLDEIEIIREKERQAAGADLLSVGTVFVHAAAQHLGLIPMMANLLRQHISSEMPVQLEQICSSILALRFLGVESEEEIHSSKTEIVWALNGQNLKEPTLAFWKKIASINLPKRFELILKNEIAQQMVHGAFFSIATESGPPVILDAQLSLLGDGKSGEALPIAKALDVLSERIIANNRPVIIESIENSESAYDQLKRLMAAFCQAEIRLKKVDVISGAGDTITSFSQIPKKRRDFIVGINNTSRYFDIAAPSLKWGSFSPLYNQRLDKIYHYAQFESTTFANEVGLPNELAKTIVISSDRENEPKKALISNLRGVSSKDIAEQYLNRWPLSVDNQSKISDLGINEINNTLELWLVDSVLSAFNLLNDLILKYLSMVAFKDFGNISDVTSLDRILYTINGKILIKDKYLKAYINSYQPERLNELLKAASFYLTRLHIIDQDKRNILVLPSIIRE